MPKFRYRAINETGTTTTGEIEADSAENANSLIATRGLIPTRVTEDRSALSSFQLSKLQEILTPVKAPELILFTKQFNTLIRAGVPMLSLLKILEEQTENIRLRSVLGTIHQDIKEGSSLNEAFGRHPKIFPPLYCSMLRAGEASGSLNQILDRLTYIIEHEHKVKSEIKSAMTYPVIVVSFLVLAFFILLTAVIPRFVNIFKNAGLELPLPTKICMFLYQALTTYWYVIIGAVVILAVALYTYLRTDQGRYTFYVLAMRIPVVGALFVKGALSRFASIFSILQASGVDILDSMDILAGTIGNYAISRELAGIKERLSEGHGISGPLSRAKYFTPMIINMVAIGEESGNLEEMLQEVAEHYDTEVEYAMKRLSDSIAPVLTIGLAAVVGFFALAIYLPMWDLTQMAR